MLNNDSADHQQESEVPPLLPDFFQEESIEESSDTEHPECIRTELDLPIEIFTSGINGALKRFPKFETHAVDLVSRVSLFPSWKPSWPSIKTFGLTFPEGVDFIPVRKKEEKENTGLKSLVPPKAESESGNKKKKPKVHEDLKGFDMKINEFGEIVSNYDMDKINEFLNENVDDKKLKDRNAEQQEESDNSEEE